MNNFTFGQEMLKMTVLAGMLFSTLRILKGILTLNSHAVFPWMMYNSIYCCNLGSKMNTPSLYYE